MNESLLQFKIFGFDDLIDLGIKFCVNFFFAFTIIRFIYYRNNPNSQYMFTFLMFNVIIFFVTYLLNEVQMKIEFAFGLFAIFTIMRYRTEQIPIKEMTFLFISITIAVISALISQTNTLTEIIIANVIITSLTFYLEFSVLKDKMSTHVITYEKIELIKPERQEDLLQDLAERTGLDIQKHEISKIDFLNDTAQIRIYYYPHEA